jgi:hypothetical protein
MFLLFLVGINAAALPPVLHACVSRNLPKDLPYKECLNVAACLVTSPRDHVEQQDCLKFCASMLALNLVVVLARIIYLSVV